MSHSKALEAAFLLKEQTEVHCCPVYFLYCPKAPVGNIYPSMSVVPRIVPGHWNLLV